MSGTQELLKKLEEDRDAYLATFQKVHDALAKSILASKNNPPSLPSSPRARAVPDRARGLSLGESDRQFLGISSLGSGISGPSTLGSSFISGETDDLSDDDEALYVQDYLPSSTFDEEHLRVHLKDYPWTEYGVQILENLYGPDGRLKFPSIFTEENTLQEDRNYSLYQIFNIGVDGAPLPLHIDKPGPKRPHALNMWYLLKV